MVPTSAREDILRAVGFLRVPLQAYGSSLPTEMREEYEQVVERLEEAARLLDPEQNEGLDEKRARSLVVDCERDLLALDHITRPGSGRPLVFQDQELNYGRLDAHRLLYHLLARW